LSVFQGNDTKLLIRIAEALEAGGTVAPQIVAFDYTIEDYSGNITQANTSQVLCDSNYLRDRLILQNISETAQILLNIDADATPGISFVIEPGGQIVLETGEADKRISISSSSNDAVFITKGRVSVANTQSA
jgi:hypothetical protein